MDEYSGKRSAGAGFSRRGSCLSFRDPNHEDRSIQYCNRLGCGARLNSMKGPQIGSPEKLKFSKSSIRSTSSKSTCGSSSKPSSASSDLRKSHLESQNQTSLQETVTVEGRGRQEQIEDSESSIRGAVILESTSTTTGIQTVLPEPEELESAILQGFSVNATEASGSCTITSHSRSRKQLNRQTGSSNQGTSSCSSTKRSITSRNSIQTVKPASQGQSGNAQRYGLRNLSCTSISDVLPSGCSSSDSSRNRRTDALRKRYPDGDSSARGNGTNGSLNGANSGSLSSGFSGPRPSILERPLPQPASRRTRNRPTSRDGVISVKTRRASSGDPRMGQPEHRDDNTVSVPEPLIIPQLPHTQFSIRESAPASSSRSFPTELPPVCQNSFGRPGSSNGTARSRPVAPPEDSSAQMFHSPLVDRDGYRRFHMEGIAEVLLALERIEQDEELTYEHLFVLETNLFLGGLGFHDQHRDMRLDIDNMSYEELLVLEEKMGTVSTALTEEALSNCLRRSIYIPASFLSGNTGCGGDDVKCSICQEEYIAGDELGILGCDHRYHMPCIHQWLRQKNWCPICKASASPL